MSDKKNEKDQKTDNWADMSDNGEEEEEEKQQEAAVEEKPKVKKPIKGTKNKDGDYVVTTIDIPDMRTGVKAEKTGAAAAMADESSDEEYDEEEDTAKETPAVEEKKEGKSHNQTCSQRS